MSRRASKVTAVIALAFMIVGATYACRTATQVELVVTYDGKCSDLNEVAFIIGTDPKVAEARIESNVFTTTTSHCEQGSPSRVGSLVVTPNDATGRASIIVLGAFGQHASDCKPEKGYAGCIIARRAFAFVDHTALTLQIPLEASCKNVPCDARSTCKNMACVNSNVSCGESGCGDPGVIGDGGIEFADAPTNPDAYVQGLDGSTMPDADVDSSIRDADADADAAPARCYPFGPVTCSSTGDRGAACTTDGDVCCRTFPMMSIEGGMGVPTDYACRAPMACYTAMSQGSGTVIRCRSERNCPGAQVCCLNTMFSGESMCMDSCQYFTGFDSGPSFPQACESSCECHNGKGCNTPQTPNGVTYLTCDP